jgi:pyrimidine-specific ribonucleoside hydrolase
MSTPRVPMIVDTDPGVDDAVALMLTAASPEVRLLAITTVFGNVDLELTTANALRVRALADMGHVPVAVGAGRPLVYAQRERADSFHGTDGLGGRASALPEPSGPVNARGAITLMSDLINSVPDRVTLVAIGPLTNIALLLAAHPAVKTKIARIVVMGGSLSIGNTAGVLAEFNILCDPEAARRVLVEEDVPTTLVPLDLTLRAAIDGAWLAELADAGPRCATLAGVIQHYRASFAEDSGRNAVISEGKVPLHDSLAVLEAAVPGTLHTEPMALEVICDHGPARGAVVPLNTGGHKVDVAVDADIPAVSATILDRLRGLQ